MMNSSFPRGLSLMPAAAVIILALWVAGAARAQEPEPYAPSPDSGYSTEGTKGGSADVAPEGDSVAPVETQEAGADSGTAESATESGDGAVDEEAPVDEEEVSGEEPADEEGRSDRKKSALDEEAKKLKPFQGAKMLVGRNVKLPVATQRFAIGIDLAVAPLNVVGKVAKDKFTDLAFDKICGSSPDQAQCREAIGTAVDVLSGVSDSQWADIRAAAAGDRQALLNALAEAGVSDPAVRDSVAEVVYSYADDVVEPELRSQAVDAVRAGASSSAMNLLFNTYLHMNFKWIEATVYAPFAIRMTDDGTEVDMANVSVDLKSGYDWNFGKVASIGLAGGIELYMPSGTKGISLARGSDVFSVPKYSYGMMTWSPYIVFGVELARIIQLQGHLELVSMHGVLDGSDKGLEMYLKYGGGFILLPRFLLSIMFELNGCTGLKNSTWDDVLMLAAGLNFRMKFFKLFFGVSLPLVDQGRYVWDSGYWTGANYDQLSKFNIMSRFGFEF